MNANDYPQEEHAHFELFEAQSLGHDAQTEALPYPQPHLPPLHPYMRTPRPASVQPFEEAVGVRADNFYQEARAHMKLLEEQAQELLYLSTHLTQSPCSPTKGWGWALTTSLIKARAHTELLMQHALALTYLSTYLARSPCSPSRRR